MRSKLFAFAALLIVASMLLTACQPAAPETIVQTVIVEGTPQVVVVTPTPGADTGMAEVSDKKALSLNMGAGDIPTLDPAVAEDTSSNQVIELLTVGLTRQNEETTDNQPGMATDWTISDDGLVYTMNIRQDVPWVKYDVATDSVVTVQDCEGNDRMVTAKDFEYGILRTLTPTTGSPYAYVLEVIQGASAFNNAETDDPTTVGVKAIDDATLEVTFNQAAAYNLNIIGMWVARAQPSWLIDGDDCTEARGDRWIETGFNQSYGPYALKEWVHDSYLTVIKNPFWPGSDAVPQANIDEITWTMLDDAPAFAEYEAGNLDVALVPLADMDRVKADPTLSTELRIAPDLCTYYYGFNTKAPVVDDVRVRRALSLAVDRQALIDNVLKGDQEPAQWFSRPGLGAAPTIEEYPDLGVKYDPEQAKAVLQEYLDETGQTADQLDISLVFNTNSGHQKIAETIQQMWKDNLGVDVKIVNQEWAVYLETVKSRDTPQLWRLGWCQDYPDANNFISDVFRVNGSSNPADGDVPYGGINMVNDQFESLLKEAAVEPDLATRTDLYAQAEEILSWDEAAIIPIYWYTRVSTTKPYVTRTFSVLGGLEHMEKWDIDMSAK
ncbi:MAG: peptide ABC transporter substrate-binding protein [Chloroflexi bacterium]|jgi:oligopeptide transport system substrate-binding protein|nr:peptide ABC transporter substrate-binding protein [Anaerolineaceae bacterium]NMB91167.1 peptide ABC transporter substrate-binding protein [Chloroflexota bacterium]